MTYITPAGNKNFDWSPKEQELVKTASTNSKAQLSDKDILYAAAKKFVKAQMALDVIEKEAPQGLGEGAPQGLGEEAPQGLGEQNPCEQAPCDKALLPEEAAGIKPDMAPEGMSGIEAKPAAGDAVAAVQELAEKVQKSEEVAGKVQQAVEKVEEAVQEVKDAVGAEAAAADEVILDVEVEEEGKVEDKGEKAEKKPFGKEEKGEKKEPKEEKGEKEEEPKEEKKEDEIIQESCLAASKKLEMKSAAADVDDFVKTSKISPTTRKKITAFWKDMLGYDAAYVKLMATDFEK